MEASQEARRGRREVREERGSEREGELEAAEMLMGLWSVRMSCGNDESLEGDEGF